MNNQKLRKFRLIDEEGFIKAAVGNSSLLDKRVDDYHKVINSIKVLKSMKK